jgi:hypothetical protein
MSNMNDDETGVGEEGDLRFISVKTGRWRKTVGIKIWLGLETI